MKRIALLNVNNKVNKTVIWTSGNIHAYFRIVSEILLDISKDNMKKYVQSVYNYILVTNFYFLCLLYSKFESF